MHTVKKALLSLSHSVFYIINIYLREARWSSSQWYKVIWWSSCLLPLLLCNQKVFLSLNFFYVTFIILSDDGSIRLIVFSCLILLKFNLNELQKIVCYFERLGYNVRVCLNFHCRRVISSLERSLLKVWRFPIIAMFVIRSYGFEGLFLFFGQTLPFKWDSLHYLGGVQELEPLPYDLSELLAEIDISRQRLLGFVSIILVQEGCIDSDDWTYLLLTDYLIQQRRWSWLWASFNHHSLHRVFIWCTFEPLGCKVLKVIITHSPLLKETRLLSFIWHSRLHESNSWIRLCFLNFDLLLLRRLLLHT